MREFIAFSLKAFYNVEKKKESEAGDMPGLREVQKAEKKANLLQAAYTCFLEKGIHKTSIDDIVARANVAKGTFYPVSYTHLSPCCRSRSSLFLPTAI